jgi:predicted anti-sigma-YlaC factor YlaD
MNLSDDQIRALLQALSRTRDHELTCDECLGELGSFAELTLEGRPVEEAYDLVQQHLQVCDECREEFALLLKAIEGLMEPQAVD